MKKIFRFLSFSILMASLLAIYSCSEEFLTKEPPGVAAGSVIQTPAGIEALIIGVYERMQNANQSMFGAAMTSDWTYSGGCSDDAYKGTDVGDQSNFNLLERYEALPNNPYLENRWNACYDGVARANVALTFLWETQKGNSKLTDARAKQAEAELKFLRAWFHFQANKIFEKIPYIKTPTELGDVKPEEVQNTDPGWTGIEEDLQYAITNLGTAKYNNEKGRPTKYSAEAVLAQAHMYQKDYTAAKPLLDDIINNGGFSLAPEYMHNFDMTHENNSESIFELQCSTTATAHSAVNGSGCNFHQKGLASCGGWGFYSPSLNLFEAFQTTAEGLPQLNPALRDHLATDMGVGSGVDFTPTDHTMDPRVDFIIARRGVDFLGWGIHPGNDWIREQSNGGPFMTKIFMHRKDEQSLNLYQTGFYNGKNYRTYRYASILLWRAECAVVDNDLELARTYVNMIRNRAKTSTPVMGFCSSTKNLGSNPDVDPTKPAANYKIEPYPGPGLYPFDTKENALKAVQEETRLEFACQNHRFFDLRRWGILATTLNAYIAHDLTFRGFMKDAVFNADQDDYWPLPQTQIDLQKGILTQDPGY
ncbi:MAG TPA: RagB/SusD family nutrient uptake outer membrane protein [Bacteroidales bacterium]|nr:RagB/SusD family nutrient uptake outer membrane protein [Bacteroidales bacterium]HOX75068.1 RagB/SusD family nutrient uptake outer membrane protein [Bacteroidales bacterium]HPM87942.1 RagB/SusD family nutrient uptake outer membrane protein [Bacteroidales bacterium]HQM67695.1 RagB/SusD family nutrient uptake outer membrane protein [Bacteroidales bacterium]